MLTLKAPGETVEQAPGALRVARRIRLIHRAADGNAQPLQQGVGDIAFLVLAAALNQGVRAEHLDHCLVQRLGPVDHDEHRAVGIKPALGQRGGLLRGRTYQLLDREKEKPVQPIHVALLASSKDAVHQFHTAALKAGATDNGPPGFRRQYGDDYYAAFVLVACPLDAKIIQGNLESGALIARGVRARLPG
jgi:hypothetical protein